MAMETKETDHTMDYSEKPAPVSGVSSGSDASDDLNAANDALFEQERKIKGFKWFLVIVSLLSGTTLYALDNTVVADLQPEIIKTFGSSALSKLPWVSVGTPLGCMATNSIWGKLFGQFNAKWLYIVTVVIFEVGSAMCGGAPNMDVLIVGRVLAGVGGVGLYIGVMTLISVNTTRHERPTYIATTGIAWGVGTVCGPIVGGAFAISKVGWRWAFYINLLFAAVQLPIAAFMIPPFNPRPGVPYKNRIAQIDYVGTILMIGASVSFVIAVNCGGQIYPWGSGQIIASFVVSGVLWVLFGLQQAFCVFTTTANRTFPCQFVKRPVFVNLFMQVAAVASISFIATYFVPLFFQYTRGDSAIEAGVRLLPLVCFTVAGTLLNGAFMSKLGYYMPWYLAGSILALVGSVLMHLVDLDTSSGNIYGYTILIGLGTGMYMMAAFAVAQAKAKPSEIPAASSFISLGQLSGVTIALAIANSVFLDTATSGVLKALPGSSEAEVQAAISGGGHTALFNSLTTETRRAVLEAITAAVGRVYILAMTGAALTTVLAVFLPMEKLFVAEARQSEIESAGNDGLETTPDTSTTVHQEQ